MNAASVLRVLSLIPERSVRTSSGSVFVPERASCQQPERFARLLRFLNWLGPLEALTKDEQRELGLLASSGRTAAAAAEEDEAELEPEADIPA
jgi:hypothetical protein